VPCTAMLWKRKKRKDYTFWHQCKDKPRIIPGCPGAMLYTGPGTKCKLQLVLCHLHCGMMIVAFQRVTENTAQQCWRLA